MHRFAAVASICGLGLLSPFEARAVTAAEKPAALALVHEYIRELGEQRDLRLEALSELHADRGNTISILGTEINYGTRVRIMLSTDRKMITGMQLPPSLQDVRRNLLFIEDMQSKVQGRMIDISTVMTSLLVDGPKPGINYGLMAAKIPQFRAMLDETYRYYVDESALMAAGLINTKPEATGKLRLIISKSDRAGIQSQLQSEFGSRFQRQSDDPFVNAAGMLTDIIDRFKCSDDPYETHSPTVSPRYANR